MTVSATDDARYRFGVFDFDAKTLDLKKQDRALKVRPQSLTLLALLVRRRGELVSREDIQLALWGRDTYVDYEQGVNHCIKELRMALGDAAESPRYIQTVPRRGYRFIAPVEAVSSAPQPAEPAAVPTMTAASDASPRRRLLARATGALTLIVALGTIAWWAPRASEPEAPPAGGPQGVRRPTTNEAAYEAYVQGMFYVRHAGPGSRERAVSFLETAVRTDPSFALAHAELGTQYMNRFFYVDADPALEQKAVVAVEKALSLDPDLAEGYLARAQLVWTLPNQFPHERAIRDLKRAIALNPTLAAAHRELGKVYLHVGLLEESIGANNRALQLNPEDSALARLVLAHMYLRQCETALQLLDQRGARNARRRAEVLRCLGREDDALQELSVQPYPSLRATLLARKGRDAAARAELEKIGPTAANQEELSHAHHSHYYLGTAYARLGDIRQAVSWLKKASSEGLPCYPLFERDPDLDSLRQDPEFLALLLELKAQADRLRSAINKGR